MSPRPQPTAIAAIGLAIAASLLLSACSFLPRIPLGDDGDSTPDDSIEDNPFLDHDIPDGFPAEVPLPDLDIYFSLRSTEQSWTIIYKANDFEADYAAAAAAFEADGWEVMMNNATPEGSLGVFAKAPYQVQVVGTPEGGDDYEGPILSFTVVATD